MNKFVINQNELQKLVANICRQISLDNWKPDYVVGITRGGLVPAVMLSHYFNVPMHTLQVSLRDGGECESNCWMAEDALGYPKQEIIVHDEADVGSILDAASNLLEQGENYKNILLVDDINDTGATFNWIMKNWPSVCLPDDPEWDNVWGHNVKFAVLVDNLASKCDKGMNYVGTEINKSENDVWVDFPWEDWWSK